jgi:hypothetical protein
MGLTISVKSDDVTREVRLSNNRATILFNKLWSAVRGVSFTLERRIKVEMPVDTGRARASWGHWSSGARNAESSPADAVWKEDKKNLSTEQGSNVDYVERLNSGHSKQAPRGFIDAAERDAQRRLEAAVDSIIAEYMRQS